MQESVQGVGNEQLGGSEHAEQVGAVLHGALIFFQVAPSFKPVDSQTPVSPGCGASIGSRGFPNPR
jgi:hypothetical protein